MSGAELVFHRVTFCIVFIGTRVGFLTCTSQLVVPLSYLLHRLHRYVGRLSNTYLSLPNNVCHDVTRIRPRR